MPTPTPQQEARGRERCIASVPFGDRMVTFHQCNRRGKVQRKGKWYCGQHDPDAIAVRNAKRSQAWDAKDRRDEEIQAEARRLAKKLGVKGEAQFNALSRLGYYTRDLVISFTDAGRLIARFAKAKKREK